MSLPPYVLCVSLSCSLLSQMVKGLVHYHEEYGGRNDRTALVWLVYNDPDKYLPQVRMISFS